MMSSREYKIFKKNFVGPVLTRKQRQMLLPPMPCSLSDSSPFYNKIAHKKYIAEIRIANGIKLGRPLPILDVSLLTSAELAELERKAKISAYVVERRKKRDKSMPLWADRKAIQAIYIKAKQLTKVTGIKYEVDHIIPSNHPLVCGLHVENNLQILTEIENILKSNTFIVE